MHCDIIIHWYFKGFSIQGFKGFSIQGYYSLVIPGFLNSQFQTSRSLNAIFTARLFPKQREYNANVLIPPITCRNVQVMHTT